MKFSTKAVHAGCEPEEKTGAIIPPIFQTSTFIHEAPGEPLGNGYGYTRLRNPTRECVEKALAALEGARHALCFSSGMGAADAAIKLLQTGEGVVASHDLYGGTYRAFEHVYKAMGLSFRYAPMHDLRALEASIVHTTRLLWVETPSNPGLFVADLSAISEICKNRGILLCVDNTMASPYLQNPLAHGADIVLHSATKYLNGHSDVIMGALAVNDTELYERLLFISQSCGAIPSPFDCFLLHRGVKTLPVRMRQHCENAGMVARFLRQHPKVNRVLWPGFPEHVNHEVAKKQMRDFSGMVSFDLKRNTVAAASKVLAGLDVFALAVSLGGVESLANHPATMTHGVMPEAFRERAGISDSLIRLSVGIEDANDLLLDLEKALR